MAPFCPSSPTNPWDATLGASSRWTLTGPNADQFAAGIDYQVTREGRPSGFLRSSRANADGLASVTQKQSAEPFRGKRIRFGAWVRVEEVTGWAGLWMRVDGEDRRAVAFDNMQNRALAGTQDWTWCEVVLDVPSDASAISYGLVLKASGQAWTNGLVLEATPPTVRVTDLLKPSSVAPPKDAGAAQSNAARSSGLREPRRAGRRIADCSRSGFECSQRSAALGSRRRSGGSGWRSTRARRR